MNPEPNAKERYDSKYEELQNATAAYQSVINEQGTYKDRLRDARQSLLDAKDALKNAAKDVNRESSVPLSGRPPRPNAAAIPTEPKATQPRKTATKKKGKGK